MESFDVITYEELEKTDVISVELVPEKKGLILKHCEYYVSSRRHGTTVSRRYNDFVQLYDVLFNKYPYRAISRLPPKRVVVGGGSPPFLQRRRAALQRWLTLIARHPVIAHDADLRSFLCETNAKLEKPKHDEFTLAGTQDIDDEMSTEEMQASFISEHEQLRLIQLGLGRLFQIFEKVEGRLEAERTDIRELGAALKALSEPGAADSQAWGPVRECMMAASLLSSKASESQQPPLSEEEEASALTFALSALEGARSLGARLTRGLHAERAAAAATPAGAHLLRRHRYALRCALQEARITRAYALHALRCLPERFRAQAEAHARGAALWSDLHNALARKPAK